MVLTLFIRSTPFVVACTSKPMAIEISSFVAKIISSTRNWSWRSNISNRGRRRNHSTSIWCSSWGSCRGSSRGGSRGSGIISSNWSIYTFEEKWARGQVILFAVFISKALSIATVTIQTKRIGFVKILTFLSAVQRCPWHSPKSQNENPFSLQKQPKYPYFWQ